MQLLQNKTDIRREVKKRIDVFLVAPVIPSVDLSELAFFSTCRTVFAYIPLVREFPTASLLYAAQQAGKKIAVPRVVKNDLEFRRITVSQDLTISPLTPGPFKLLEPADTAPLMFSPTYADDALLPLLVLTPGRAFSSKDGSRIGYGAGFYDRFFSALYARFGQAQKSIMPVGLCYSCQLFETLPADSHDVPMQAILTENGIHAITR